MLAIVDKDKRMAIARNHTTTHLLHKALKSTVGDHAEQAGSMVDKDRLRFDFRHFTALTTQDIETIERMVNKKIMECLIVESEEMSLNDAKNLGATALFGEKYGDTVRVVKIGDYSTELCGGTHLSNTGQAGFFRIIAETSIAAGIRRIEAVTGWNTYDLFLNHEYTIAEVSAVLKTTPSDLEKRAINMVKQLKDLEKEIDTYKINLLKNTVDTLLASQKKIGSISCIIVRTDEHGVEELRTLADMLKDKINSLVVVLAAVKGEKVYFVGSASEDNVLKGVHIGKLIGDIAKITGGGGGGRADMAQAGGKDSSKVDEALVKAEVILANQIGIF